jgi:hypothetical protein
LGAFLQVGATPLAGLLGALASSAAASPRATFLLVRAANTWRAATANTLAATCHGWPGSTSASHWGLAALARRATGGWGWTTRWAWPAPFDFGFFHADNVRALQHGRCGYNLGAGGHNNALRRFGGLFFGCGSLGLGGGLGLAGVRGGIGGGRFGDGLGGGFGSWRFGGSFGNRGFGSGLGGRFGSVFGSGSFGDGYFCVGLRRFVGGGFVWGGFGVFIALGLFHRGSDGLVLELGLGLLARTLARLLGFGAGGLEVHVRRGLNGGVVTGCFAEPFANGRLQPDGDCRHVVLNF